MNAATAVSMNPAAAPHSEVLGDTGRIKQSFTGFHLHWSDTSTR